MQVHRADFAIMECVMPNIMAFTPGEDSTIPTAALGLQKGDMEKRRTEVMLTASAVLANQPRLLG